MTNSTDHPASGNTPAPLVPRPVCGTCHGNRGCTVNGNWQTCTTCQGTGLGGGNR